MSKKTKTTYLLFAFFVLGLVIHNAIYALFSIEEPFAFIVSVLAGPTLLVYITVNTIIFIKTKKPKDWPKVAWLILIVFLFFIWIRVM